MNLQAKLTSRKFWFCAIAIIIGTALVIMGDTQYGASLILSGVLGYVTAEGIGDALGRLADKTVTTKSVTATSNDKTVVQSAFNSEQQ